jgi:hypothetical protein
MRANVDKGTSMKDTWAKPKDSIEIDLGEEE